MDTGCAHDLVNKAMAEGYGKERLDRPYAFTTANGSVMSYQTVPMHSKMMGGNINPYLLSDTPAVLSIGRRCMEEGYSFIWNANEAPYLQTPTGGCIPLRLERNIPYLDTRDDTDNSPLSQDAALPLAVDDDGTMRDDAGPNFDSDDEELHEAVIVGEAAGDAKVKDEEKAKEEPKVTSRFRDEAKSNVHQLIHIPKNPFCDVCQRGKNARTLFTKRCIQTHSGKMG